MKWCVVSRALSNAVPELAHELERARIEAGLSTDDLLRSLREQRERYRREHHDDAS